MWVKTTEKEHCPEDEHNSVVSVFERTQQSVPMHVFLPTRFEQAKKMTMSKIYQNYGKKMEDVTKILTGQFVCTKYSYLSAAKNGDGCTHELGWLDGKFVGWMRHKKGHNSKTVKD